MSANGQSTAALLQRLPDLDRGKMPAVDTTLAKELVAAVLKDGQAGLAALIDSLREVDDGGDWKSRFLLQAVVVHVGHPDQTAARDSTAAALLEHATGSRPAGVRIFLLGCLRWIAGPTAVAKLVPLLADPALAAAAAGVAVSIGPPAKAALTAALPSAQAPAKEAIQNALAQIS